MADKKYIYGIDLGTTYSCISYVDPNGMPVAIKNAEGVPTTPSVVHFSSATEILVGDSAKEMAILEPENTVTFVKRLMGKTDMVGTYFGEKQSPEQISARILGKLAKDAGEAVQSEVKDVVITCPAYFGTAERMATKNAGRIAGLNVIEVISEPTAAALSYGMNKANQGQECTFMVYDLGGGTFDITAMHIDAEGHIQVLCSDGMSTMGGMNWDAKLVAYMEDELRAKTGTDEELTLSDRQTLMSVVEKVKKQLTFKEKTFAVLNLEIGRGQVEITREKFEELTASLLNDTIAKTRNVIENAEKGTEQRPGYKVEKILLVGGSTRMPQVKNALEREFGLELVVHDPDEAVAKGAALYALGAYEGKVEEWKDKVPVDDKDKEEAAKYQEEAAVSTRVIGALGGRRMEEVVTVATTKSYALNTFVNNTEEKRFNMIIKNSPMEDGIIISTNRFFTREDYQQSALIEIYENDYQEEYYALDDCKPLGEAELKLSGEEKANSPIEITFSLNREGILGVKAIDLVTGNDIYAEFKTSAGTMMEEDAVKEAIEKTKSITIA